MIEIAEFRKLKSNPIRFLEVATQLLKELDTTKEAVLRKFAGWESQTLCRQRRTTHAPHS